MSIIPITSDNLEKFKIRTNPKKTIVSSSSGLTGSVYVFGRVSPREKDAVNPTNFNVDFFDDVSLEDLRKDVKEGISNALSNIEAGQPVTSLDKHSAENRLIEYMKKTNSLPPSVVKGKRVEVIRFEPSFHMNKDTMRKNVVKNVLFPHYKPYYSACEWSYPNYHTLNFFTGSTVSNSSCIMYPCALQTSQENLEKTYKYTPGNEFTFEFWINPRYTTDKPTHGPGGRDSDQHYHPGTIMHLSSSYCISLVSGSSINTDGYPDKFRIMFQVGHGAQTAPHKIILNNSNGTNNSNSLRKGASQKSNDELYSEREHLLDLVTREASNRKNSTTDGIVALSEDNTLSLNHWHHVAIRGKIGANNDRGTFYIDGVKKGSFKLAAPGNTDGYRVPTKAAVNQTDQSQAPYGFIMPMSASADGKMSPDVLIIGNYMDTRFVSGSEPALARFFNVNKAYTDGLVSMFRGSFSKERELDGTPTHIDPPGSQFKMTNPLNAEIHEIRIWKEYRSLANIVTGSRSSLTELSGSLMFYLPPWFTKETRRREVLQTPFQTHKSKTDDPFNVSLSFGVGARQINLPNFTREIVRGTHPRLYHLTASQNPGNTQFMSANELLYDAEYTNVEGKIVESLEGEDRGFSGIRKGNLTVLPNDNGLFTPSYSLLGSKHIDLGNLGAFGTSPGIGKIYYREQIPRKSDTIEITSTSGIKKTFEFVDPTESAGVANGDLRSNGNVLVKMFEENSATIRIPAKTDTAAVQSFINDASGLDGKEFTLAGLHGSVFVSQFIDRMFFDAEDTTHHVAATSTITISGIVNDPNTMPTFADGDILDSLRCLSIISTDGTLKRYIPGVESFENRRFKDGSGTYNIRAAQLAASQLKDLASSSFLVGLNAMSADVTNTPTGAIVKFTNLATEGQNGHRTIRGSTGFVDIPDRLTGGIFYGGPQLFRQSTAQIKFHNHTLGHGLIAWSSRIMFEDWYGGRVRYFVSDTSNGGVPSGTKLTGIPAEQDLGNTTYKYSTANAISGEVHIALGLNLSTATLNDVRDELYRRLNADDSRFDESSALYDLDPIMPMGYERGFRASLSNGTGNTRYLNLESKMVQGWNPEGLHPGQIQHQQFCTNIVMATFTSFGGGSEYAPATCTLYAANDTLTAGGSGTSEFLRPLTSQILLEDSAGNKVRYFISTGNGVASNTLLNGEGHNLGEFTDYNATSQAIEGEIHLALKTTDRTSNGGSHTVSELFTALNNAINGTGIIDITSDIVSEADPSAVAYLILTQGTLGASGNKNITLRGNEGETYWRNIYVRPSTTLEFQEPLILGQQITFTNSGGGSGTAVVSNAPAHSLKQFAGTHNFAQAVTAAESLQLAIEHPSGHGGKISVSRNYATLTLTQTVRGLAGNTISSQLINAVEQTEMQGLISSYYRKNKHELDLIMKGGHPELIASGISGTTADYPPLTVFGLGSDTGEVRTNLNSLRNVEVTQFRGGQNTIGLGGVTNIKQLSERIISAINSLGGASANFNAVDLSTSAADYAAHDIKLIPSISNDQMINSISTPGDMEYPEELEGYSTADQRLEDYLSLGSTGPHKEMTTKLESPAVLGTCFGFGRLSIEDEFSTFSDTFHQAYTNLANAITNQFSYDVLAEQTNLEGQNIPELGLHRLSSDFPVIGVLTLTQGRNGSSGNTRIVHTLTKEYAYRCYRETMRVMKAAFERDASPYPPRIEITGGSSDEIASSPSGKYVINLEQKLMGELGNTRIISTNSKNLSVTNFTGGKPGSFATASITITGPLENNTTITITDYDENSLTFRYMDEATTRFFDADFPAVPTQDDYTNSRYLVDCVDTNIKDRVVIRDFAGGETDPPVEGDATDKFVDAFGNQNLSTISLENMVSTESIPAGLIDIESEFRGRPGVGQVKAKAVIKWFADVEIEDGATITLSAFVGTIRNPDDGTSTARKATKTYKFLTDSFDQTIMASGVTVDQDNSLIIDARTDSSIFPTLDSLDEGANVNINDVWFKFATAVNGFRQRENIQDIVAGETYIILQSGGNFVQLGAPDNNPGTQFIATHTVFANVTIEIPGQPLTKAPFQGPKDILVLRKSQDVFITASAPSVSSPGSYDTFNEGPARTSVTLVQDLAGSLGNLEITTTGTWNTNIVIPSKFVGGSDNPGASILNSLEGASPEDPGVQPGSILTVLNRTRDPSSNEVVFFDVSNLYYGNKIRPNTFVIKDSSLTGSGGRVGMTLRDNGRGGLYRDDCKTPTAKWNEVGAIMYEEGISVIKSPNIPFFGRDQFEMSFEGDHNVHVMELNVPCPKGKINSSSNPNYKKLIPSDYASDTAKQFVYISTINLHDENFNVIGRANLAQPIIKRDTDGYMFRLKMDF